MYVHLYVGIGIWKYVCVFLFVSYVVTHVDEAKQSMLHSWMCYDIFEERNKGNKRSATNYSFIGIRQQKSFLLKPICTATS